MTTQAHHNLHRTTISISRELLGKARKFAKKERRNFSAQLEKWIEEKLEESTPKGGAK